MFGFFIGFTLNLNVYMKTKIMNNEITYLYSVFRTKEVLIVFYFLFFILGLSSNTHYPFYDEYRVFEIATVLIFGLLAIYSRQFIVNKIELLFFAFIGMGSLFWQQPLFIVADLLLVYLLFKVFQVLGYNELITKAIVLASFVLFLMLPVALFDYINSGSYIANWYPLSWNIRIYNSYFLILSIFAVWFYATNFKYKSIYLVFLFLAFFTVLLDGGRSVTLAYTAFISIVAIFHKSIRLPLIVSYMASWLAYLAVTYASNLGSSSLRIARESSSGRIDLWVNGLMCWAKNPIVGCGFYQLEQFSHLPAHPHNIFIQVLTETGLIGLGFLAFMIFNIVRHISWNIKQNYFVMAALLAVSIDMSLSGVHIYPITQMALLWLFVFLLKNPEFKHAQYFNQPSALASRPQQLLAILIYTLIGLWFIYIIMQSFNLPKDLPTTPPRFWGYGYLLY